MAIESGNKHEAELSSSSRRRKDDEGSEKNYNQLFINQILLAGLPTHLRHVITLGKTSNIIS
jgi:hypothetical protein